MLTTSFTSVFSPRRIALPIGLLLLASALFPVGRAAESAPATPRILTIAVVKDGPSSLLDEIETAFRQEAETLTAGRAILRFSKKENFDASWREGDAAGAALDAALADSSVDYVLALGVRATCAAAAPERTLTKPVLGALVQESDLVPLPVGPDGRSQKQNFAVVALPSRAADQVPLLRSAVPFASLSLLVDEFFAPNSTALDAWRDQLARKLKLAITIVPLGTRAEDALASLPSNPQAVLLFPAIRMDGSNRAALLQGLSARKFPVFSFVGQSDVEAGALAGVLPNPRAAIVRRLAINLDQIIAGTPVAELPLQVTVPQQLFFNESVAAAVGFAPDFNALNHATIIGHFTPSAGQPLTFTAAVVTALEKNFDFRARQSATEASRQSARSATGALLPQLAASQNYQQIDRDRATASGGAQAQSTYRAGLGLSQTLLDDEAFTRVKIARTAQRGASYQEQAERLDTVHSAGQAYLQWLSAQASVRVAEENLKVTQRNLELAQLRQRVGTSGPEEGYRFESLAAQQRSELLSARSQADRARVGLNRVLGVKIDTLWQAHDVSLEDPAFSFTTGRVIALLRDREKLDRFRSFTSAYAAEHSPDLLAVDESVRAQRLTADERKRRGYTPKISASLNYARVLHQEFAGPSLADQFGAAGLPVHGTSADRDDWTIGVSASLPLFTGGSLTAEARKARAELRQRELARDGTREAVIAQTQSSLYAAESAYSAIALSVRAAELATQNLAVVQDKYEHGAVSIVTLLDAQNSAFAQRQSADVSVYKFLSELLRLQRSFGWMEVLATSAEKEAWFHQMEQAIAL